MIPVSKYLIGFWLYYLRASKYTKYDEPTAKIVNYNLIINGIKFFDEPLSNDEKTYDNIQKITSGEGDDYTNGCKLNYPYFKDHCKKIRI